MNVIVQNDITPEIKKCKLIIDNQIRTVHKYTKFYIGVTSDKQKRLAQHKIEKNMHHMIDLCECKSKDDAINIEKALINEYKKFTKRCENSDLSCGGEGLIEGKNYVYLLLT